MKTQLHGKLAVLNAKLPHLNSYNKSRDFAKGISFWSELKIGKDIFIPSWDDP